MKKIKKLLILFLPIIILMLSSCDFVGAKPAYSDNTFDIVVTIFPIYDTVNAVLENHTEDLGNFDNYSLTMLIGAGDSIHSFDPSAAVIKQINECDLFIYIGGQSDSWVERLLASGEHLPNGGVLKKGENGGKILRLIDYVDTIEISENNEIETDEHIWTSPANMKIMAREIADALAVDSSEYEQKLDELDAEIREIVDTAECKKIIIADKYNLRYFAEHYGLEVEAAASSCNDHSDISPAAIIRLTEMVRSEKISFVYYGELSDKNAANIIASETGAKLLLLHSVQNVTAEEFAQKATYLSLMRQNAENLKKGLL